MEHALAYAIGIRAADAGGLSKVVLPRGLPPAFRRDLADGVRANGGHAEVVGNQPGLGEISPGQAIAYRTPESGVAPSVVIIAATGDSPDLKSLETFRDLLASGMLGSPASGTSAFLNLQGVCEELAEQVARLAKNQFDRARLARSIADVLDYLSAAYEKAGNQAIAWQSAYWLHADDLARFLPRAIDSLAPGLPRLELLAVHLAAGLPYPDSGEAYEVKNGPERYAETVESRWSTGERCERSVAEIDSSGDGTSHPLNGIDWATLASTRASAGHAVLALCRHGRATRERVWADAWSATSETEFFSRPRTETVIGEFQYRQEQNWKNVAELGWSPAIHVLPAARNTVGPDQQLALGHFRLRIESALASQGQAIHPRLDSSPKSAAEPELVEARALDGAVEIEFRLSRKVRGGKGKWREKPFNLSVVPNSTGPANALRDPVVLRLVAPHPARPTVFIGEQARGKKPIRAKFHADTPFKVEPGSMGLEPSDGDAELMFELDGGDGTIEVVVAGHEGPVTLDDASIGEAAVDAVNQLEIKQLPEDPVLAAGAHSARLVRPTIEGGKVHPVLAALSGEPLVPVEGETRTELERDPRFHVEQWLAGNCIKQPPGVEFRRSLGSALVSITREEDGDRLFWNERLGAFANFDDGADSVFATGIEGSEEAGRFWKAFEELGLPGLVGDTETTALPSALPVDGLDRGKLEAYLRAYAALAKAGKDRHGTTVGAYPFSVILLDRRRGRHEGVLLSPLHPLRLAWSVGIQDAARDLASCEVFGEVASSFLRFVDGESLPLVGPKVPGHGGWLSLGLSPGPSEFFSSWSLLADSRVHSGDGVERFFLLRRELPLGAPSGLGRGSVDVAIRDYLRVYPSTGQLRVSISSATKRQRLIETDEAIISAASRLLNGQEVALPGGIRVFDDVNRQGLPPSPHRVLSRFASQPGTAADPLDNPAFEWTVTKQFRSVDLRFMENTLVELEVSSRGDGDSPVGSSGPVDPVARFKSWHHSSSGSQTSTFSMGFSPGSFSQMPGFHEAIACVEGMAGDRERVVLESTLLLGDPFFGGQSLWTIMGNKHLDPSILSMQLRQSGAGLSLWEWRPAFLGRSSKETSINSISSGHPYTVLTRTPDALLEEIQKTMNAAGIAGASPNQARSIVEELGTRGIGLSSLLAMGHTQSMGALGFYFAYVLLDDWETSGADDETRCVLPMDAVFPLLELLGNRPGDRLDDKRRADLLLVKSTQGGDGPPKLELHPVEVKARSSAPARFPSANSAVLVEDPLVQLSSSAKLLQKVAENFAAVAGERVLVGSAFGTLIEAALMLRPPGSRRDPAKEAILLEAIGRGEAEITVSPGTLLWLQAHGSATGGAPYEPREPADSEAGQFMSSFAAAREGRQGTEIGRALTQVIEARTAATATGLPNRTPPRPVTPEDDSPAGTGETDPLPDTTPEKEVRDAPEAPPGETDIVDPPPPDDDANPGNTVEPAEEATEGIEILVGHEQRGTRMLPIMLKPSETNLTQLNMGVVGDLGTGKTQFLKSIVYQLAKAGPSNRGITPKSFIFDYKNDYSGDDFVKAIDGQLLDPTRTLPLNFLALPPDAANIQKVQRANFFVDLLRRISGIGQVQRNLVYESVRDAYQACQTGYWPTLEDVLSTYREKSGGRQDSVVSVLTLMIDLEIFERNPGNITSFEEVFDKTTVLRLSQLGAAGQEVVDIIATMFLDFLYTDYMKNREKHPFLTGKDGVNRRVVDSYVLIDEAHHAMGRGFDVLMKLMLEGREFGMGVILSSQFLSHFQLGDHDWAEALSTWMVHKVRQARPTDFERIGFRGQNRELADQIAKLEPHWGYYRCANGQNEGTLMRGQPYFLLHNDA
ncbi:ATP-binding protein [Minwuia thermotolerans]|uniref:ATP-binding protein n=1 Tax=Minwuia thermotolerans TaxID=2056226 RepID=UPI000F6428B0|nr:ATP-binding protein [Minwuia thermotolerans]